MDKVVKLRKKNVPYEEVSALVKRLAFYPENPRIYSQFAGTTNRTQKNIQEMLESREHVRELRSQIDRDGQVNEALYCIPVPEDSDLHGEFDYQVLEGNSRLAALRMPKRGSLPQTSVRCYILNFSEYSETERESLIFSLLGQFHITGKKKWESYESAAYIYRRYKSQKISLENVAKEIGNNKSKGQVQKTIEAFELMIKAGDEKQAHWSYYEAYVSSTKIKKYREKHDGLDDRVIPLIKEEKFSRALDMRDKLPVVLGNKKARKIFFDKEEKEPFREAIEIADMSGDTNTTFKRLERFRTDLGTDDTRSQVRKLLRAQATRGKTEYELKQISRFVADLLKGRTGP